MIPKIFASIRIALLLSLVACLMPAAAQAVPIQFLLSYEPSEPALGGDDTFLDVTAFFDSDDITGTGTEDILLTSFEATFNGSVTNNVDLIKFYTNDVTGPCNFLCGGPFTPVTGRFNNGAFIGFLQGLQPGVSGTGMATLSFDFCCSGTHGGGIRFNSGASPHKFNAEVDFFEITGFSGPFPVQASNTVPEPATLVLFGVGLAGVGLARRRRNRVG